MKMVILAAALAGAVATFGVGAQDSGPARAGQQIGQLLFGRPDDGAYYDHLARAAQTRAYMESARLAAAQTHTMELEAEIRTVLQGWWESAGFSADEATAIASAYRADASQVAITERAKRDGSKATFAAVASAYKGYNYLLANQLLIGAIVALQAERQATPAPAASVPSQP